jgi:hypothetical protein
MAEDKKRLKRRFNQIKAGTKIARDTQKKIQADKPKVFPNLSDSAFFGKDYDSLTPNERAKVKSLRASRHKLSRDEVRDMAPHQGRKKHFGPLSRSI